MSKYALSVAIVSCVLKVCHRYQVWVLSHMQLRQIEGLSRFVYVINNVRY